MQLNLLAVMESHMHELTLAMHELEGSWVFRRWLMHLDTEHADVLTFVLQVFPTLRDLPDDIIDTHLRALIDRVRQPNIAAPITPLN